LRALDNGDGTDFQLFIFGSTADAAEHIDFARGGLDLYHFQSSLLPAPPSFEGRIGFDRLGGARREFRGGGDDASDRRGGWNRGGEPINRTATGEGPRFSLPGSTTTSFRLIRSPCKIEIKSLRLEFVGLNLINKFQEFIFSDLGIVGYLPQYAPAQIFAL